MTSKYLLYLYSHVRKAICDGWLDACVIPESNDLIWSEEHFGAGNSDKYCFEFCYRSRHVCVYMRAGDEIRTHDILLPIVHEAVLYEGENFDFKTCKEVFDDIRLIITTQGRKPTPFITQFLFEIIVDAFSKRISRSTEYVDCVIKCL